MENLAIQDQDDSSAFMREIEEKVFTEDRLSVLEPRSGTRFIETPFVKSIIHRATKYLQAGFPLHFRGVSGTGKTTLALRVAELIGRPVLMVHGDEELSTKDLVGSECGYHMKKLRDNFISSVLKIEEESSKRWIDNRLTVAVEEGYTLIYDEFTRSRPEANNALLSVLQEGILDLPSGRGDGVAGYIQVHPEFHAIFTSNPEEYAGVHRSQDALRDRMVILDLESLDEETECRITQAKSGLSLPKVSKIVGVVRYLREHGQYEFTPTVRACIMIARTLREYGRHARTEASDPIFTQVCLDILGSATSRIGSKTTSARVREVVKEAIQRYCGNGRTK